MYYECEICKKRFISEKLVKTHLQWFHNIPPYERFEILKQVKKELDDISSLNEYFWN